MAGNGPQPTPLKILRARGSWRAKAKKDVLDPEPGIPVCPQYLPDDAKAIWMEMAPTMERMGVLSVADASALERYAFCFAMWRRIAKLIDQFGTTYVGTIGIRKWMENGVQHAEPIKEPRIMPTVRAFEAFSTQLSRVEQAFGLTPASRTRITQSKSEKKDGAGDDRFFKVG